MCGGVCRLYRESAVRRERMPKLEVAQPPIAAFGFEICEPSAGWVERDDDEEPDCVDHPERVSEVGWEEIFGATHRRRGAEEDWIRAGAIAKPCAEKRQKMDEVKVRDEVKERDTPEDDERICCFEAIAIKKREKDQGWTESHEEVQERRRIFAAVEEGKKCKDRRMLR